jgi:PKD repeat protein
VPNGTQTNLTDASNGLAHVQNTATQWGGVANSSVHIGYSASAPASGAITVNLDVSTSGSWSAPMDCSMGVIGYGGPNASGGYSFKGDSPYYAIQVGSVSMRKSICSTGYPYQVFRTAVLHEVGHTLGLGHPDQVQSQHSTTTPTDWNNAVMHSSVPSGQPSTPQTDDIAAIRFYYGTGTSPPVAAFTFSPSSPLVNQTVQFTDTSTGAPTSWSWNFGDSGTSTLQNPTHAYAAAGPYTVTLTATNAGGPSQTTHTVTVSSTGPSPTASFTFSPSSPLVSQTVQFTDTSTNSPTSWSWNFGDLGTSSVRNPTHAWSAPGYYTVTLTATNGNGSNQTSRLVTVSSSGSAPIANFRFSPASPLVNQAVQFTDTSTGSPTSWSWNFGDTGTSALQNSTHTWVATGSYTVMLTAANASGYTQTTRTVNVSSCVEDANTMCLIGGRYRITSRWKNQYAGGVTAAMYKATLTDATGAFWLLDGNTYEFMIRIDTATNNGRAWIAIPTFTDVEFWIDVTDTKTNEFKEYHSAPGNQTLIYDPYFFTYPSLRQDPTVPPASALAPTSSPDSAPGMQGVAVSLPSPSVSCAEDANTMCLIGGRYQVTSRWKNQYAGGATATMYKAKLTDATGAFWLSDANTYEFMIRVDTATNNGRAWIAIPSFTDVEFWIDLTDTQTGQSKEYHSQPGNQTLIYDPYFFVYP